ncbi:MAG: thioredoxin domain-containing protein [Candidatus Protochlamydia sp.]|nr:thioredoxin domain-containing protein [Candidatus Protochlamydia sp.]
MIKVINRAFIVFFMFFLVPALQANQRVVEESIESNLVLGNPKSRIKIYVISDWFCTSCKKIEPRINEIYNDLKNKAAFYFIDYPLHRDSANFTPYHLAFLMGEKNHYLRARDALLELSKGTTNPTDENISELAHKNQLRFTPLSYEKIRKGSDYFEEVRRHYKVAATPTIVVVNAENDNFETLTGSEIDKGNIEEAVRSVLGQVKKKKAWYKFWK